MKDPGTAADERYMRQALTQARKAFRMEETPIGCVIVRTHDYEGNPLDPPVVIARGYNRRNTDKSTLAHAEIIAIRRAAKVLGDWRLEGCTLFVTLEPCAMCAGAVLNARIPAVVYGLREGRTGACGSVLDLFAEDFGFRPRMYGGVREAECRDLMQRFFSRLRE